MRAIQSPQQYSPLPHFRDILLTAAALLLCAAANAQTQGGSLADVARQARAQKQSQSSTSAADQVANELSEDQNDDAPGGFKTYKAADYKLWVPAPFTEDTHNPDAVVLSGPEMGSRHNLVLIGNPIPYSANTGSDTILDAATGFVRKYLASASCEKSNLGSQNAYECDLSGAKLMGSTVTGSAWFIPGSGNLYPVFCATPIDGKSWDTLSNPHSTEAQKATARETLDRDPDLKRIWQNCDTLFHSFRIKPAAASKVADSKPSADAPQPATPRPAQQAASAMPARPSTVPAGYKAQAFQYCTAPTQCWDASVLLPADAQLVSSDCKQYAFQVNVQGTPLLLMAGPATSDCGPRPASDTSLVRWKELVDPETRRAPGTSSTISSQTTTIDGKPAAIITIGFRKGLSEFMGKRAEVEANGTQVVVGCVAPRDRFPDGDAICSALIDSLRLP
jgi:hypothetical protein